MPDQRPTEVTVSLRDKLTGALSELEDKALELVLDGLERSAEGLHRFSERQLRRAADHADPAGQFKLFQIFATGTGVTRDPELAQRLLRSSAERGHAPAQFELGQALDVGTHGERSPAEAAQWYLKAAQQEHAWAQFNLGVMYSAGQGVQRDLVEAYAWLHRAGGAGMTAAGTYIKRLVQSMDPALLMQARLCVGNS